MLFPLLHRLYHAMAHPDRMIHYPHMVPESMSAGEYLYLPGMAAPQQRYLGAGWFLQL